MNYVSYTQLAKDVIEFSSLAGHYDAIVGVPRSGMPAASMLALYRNVALTSTPSLLQGRYYCGGQRCPKDKIKRILILDDSVLAGKQLTIVKERLEDLNCAVDYACMYMKPGSEHHVNYYFKKLELPRIFEWNAFHSYWMQFACLDIDGVLCHDPTREENDDSVRYRNFLTSVRCLHRPTVQIQTLVTSRLEKYRRETTAWLQRNGIKYKRLVMHPARSAIERRAAGDHASRKANEYRRAEYKLFVESSQRQALEIHKRTGKPVLCTDNGKMYA